MHRKKSSKFQKLKKYIYNTVPFSLALQACSSKFSTSVKTDYKENLSFECSEILGSLAKKDL